MVDIVVDIEADGPIPNKYSMICFGAVVVENALNRTFYGECSPISDLWIPDALKVSGFTREDCMGFNEPKQTMCEFADWIKSVSNGGRVFFYSDNNGFDWQFINYYFHTFYGSNPFGYSSSNIGSLYKGLVKNCHKNFKHLRKIRHTHHPVDDAIGNAEALLYMRSQMGLK